ncbi:hypothetical protein ACQJBY_010374 [Aegilops geniculata]
MPAVPCTRSRGRARLLRPAPTSLALLHLQPAPTNALTALGPRPALARLLLRPTAAVAPSPASPRAHSPRVHRRLSLAGARRRCPRLAAPLQRPFTAPRRPDRRLAHVPPDRGHPRRPSRPPAPATAPASARNSQRLPCRCPPPQPVRAPCAGLRRGPSLAAARARPPLGRQYALAPVTAAPSARFPCAR